jgi:hypothetical protein
MLRRTLPRVALLAALMLAGLCSAGSAAPLSDIDAQLAMRQLLAGSRADAAARLEQVIASNDQRFAAVLIELLWARRVGMGPGLQEEDFGAALNRLAGQQFGDDWRAWVEWYGGTDLRPPPGFRRWKSVLMSYIDPALGDLLGAEGPARIRVEEVLWGGVRVDGIPALDHPRTLSPAAAGYLEPEEPVFGLAFHGAARAYPLRILDWHEMANDTLGGVAFSLSYCTLCGAAVAYRSTASDGKAYTFGSSGFLYRSNKLMYDRQTRSLWNQLTGEPVLGPLAETAAKLELLPVVLTTWRAWREEHPGTTVLSLDTGHERPYVHGMPYGDYFAAPGTMFPVWQRSKLLADKSRIYALRVNGVPKAYPLEALIRERVVNDTLAGQEVVLIAAGPEVETAVTGRTGGEARYASGAEVRAYRRGGNTFRPHAQPARVSDARGRPWRVTEDALVDGDGTRLERLPGHLAYWFGWFAFFPKTLVHGRP